MATTYETIAGRSIERLAALSDGVFAIAMTLLVLDLRVPAGAAIHGEHALFSSVFVALAPRLVPYVLSFMTLGIFWIAQQAQLDAFARSDRTLTWINLGFLLAVTIMPFTTGVLAEFITFRLAVVAYWLNLVLLGATLWASGRYGWGAGLTKEQVTSAPRVAHERRIVAYQVLYAIAAALCVVSTYLSIALFVLLQLNSMLGLRFPRLRGSA